MLEHAPEVARQDESPERRAGPAGSPAAPGSPAGDPATEDRPADDRPPRRRLTAFAPATVWLVTAAWVVVLLTYSLLLPIFRAPDEPSHMALTLYVADHLSYPRWDGMGVDDGVGRASALAGLSAARRDRLSEPAPRRNERPSFQELRDPPSGSPRLNQLSQHPPLYYALAGGLDRLADDVVPGQPLRAYDRETWVLRLLGVALMAPAPLIVWRLARRVGLPYHLGVGASLVPLVVPQLAHIGASVNNDTLVVLLAWLATVPIVALAQGDLRRSTALWAGALVGLALFTKGLALVFPLWLALAAGVAWWRHRGWVTARAAAAATAVAGAAALVAGGWWWIRNLVLFDKLAPSIEYERRGTIPGFVPDPGTFADEWYYRNARTFWGTFGWGEAVLPTWLFAGASVVALVAIGLALRPRVRGVDGGTRLVLVAAWPLLAAFAAYNAWDFYDRSGTIPLLQGRYWFGALAGVAVLAVLGPGSLLRPRGQRLVPLAVVTMAVVLHTVATREILTAYWAGEGASTGDRLAALVAWSPVPGPLMAAGAVAGSAVLAVLVVRLVLEARAGAAGAEAEPVGGPPAESSAS